MHAPESVDSYLEIRPHIVSSDSQRKGMGKIFFKIVCRQFIEKINKNVRLRV